VIRFISLFAITALFGGSLPAWSATHAPVPVHIRGTIQRMAGDLLTVRSASGPVWVRLASPLKVEALVPSSLSHVKDGSFVGITSVPQPNGSQRAVEIHVFPKSMRGAGEGTRPWDWPGRSSAGSASHSRMTNGTVSHLRKPGRSPRSRMTNGTVTREHGRSALTVRYRTGAATGSQTIIIPAHVPVVTFVSGSRSDLKPGAHVFIMAARHPNGKLTAGNILVGKNGVVPPM